MNIILCSFGTTGDINPFLDMAEAFIQAGDKVILLLNPADIAKAEKRGLKTRTCGKSFSLDKFLQSNPEMTSFRGSSKLWDKCFLPQVIPSYQATSELIQSFKADAIISHFMCIGSQWAAINQNILNIQVHLAPCSLFSAEDTALFSIKYSPQWLNTLLVSLGRLAVNRHINKGLESSFKQLGLDKPERNFFKLLDLAQVRIALWPGKFRRQVSGDPDTLHTCGFPTARNKAAVLSEETEQFLLNNPNPVVVGLGTSARNLAREVYESIALACDQLDLACILVGCDDRDISRRLNNVLVTRFEPFSQVFPRAEMIIHHGGIGTTAEALNSARPSIVIPFMLDQFDNADRCQRLGVALTLSRSGLSVKKLKEAILKLSKDTDIESASAALAISLVEQKSGAEVAANRVREMVKETGPNLVGSV